MISLSDTPSPAGPAASLTATLEKVIWQVCKSPDHLPEEYGECRRTWLDHNPGWRLELVSNSESRSLFAELLPEYLDVFDSLPLGVMQADMWRYGVLLVHGGFYADVDTYCLTPIGTWLPPEDEGMLHLSGEGGTPWFCQWVIPSPAGHPVLRVVLDLIAERVRADGGVDLERDDCVHYYTGPEVWSEAVRRTLGTDLSIEEIRENQHLARSAGVIVHPTRFFAHQVVRHGYASFTWGRRGYVSWRDDIRSRFLEHSEPRAALLKTLFIPRACPWLKRYGAENDAAFVLSEEILGKSAYLLALGKDTEFNRQVASAGTRVISTQDLPAGTAEGLEPWVEACGRLVRDMPEDGATARPDLPDFSMKMDVEGREYGLLDDCPPEVLGRCAQLAIEFHHLPNCGVLDGVGSRYSWETREAVVRKLLETHHLVHLHANNYGGLIHGFPEVVECLFVNKKWFSAEPAVWATASPRAELDRPNRRHHPELVLAWWMDQGCGTPRRSISAA
ncbi:hypothetical protein JIN84_00425 [Luteolibacter yonseiensis]|uniref:Uncharacterized protein n=1 Tax=Luteolibacter yonseiensis TaxID=1144680 RepID=A0A934V5L4_9BACT|nr:glycosyltransferase [Luteolibacter yonseiensis]MBK1814072.1 hypothetical protein [Luteolibacter yonseiensis]